MIADFKIGDKVDNVFYCASKISSVAKNGSTYYSVVLQDKTGQIDGKIWEVNDALIGDFEKGDFVQVVGTVSSFKDTNQIIINGISVVDKSKVDISDYCPITPKDIEELSETLISLIDSVKNEWYKKLLKCFFGNEKFFKRFASASAAKSVHHAYVGGLLEHSVTTATICSWYTTIYPKLNRDLLITAALCHDIGKIKEISAFPENDYTDEGNLLGHIYMGTEMIDVQARKIEGFPKAKLVELKHCILAHHGKLEYGSPETPKLIEAMALNMADDTDAKMRYFSDILEGQVGWSEKKDFVLGTVFRPTTE